MKTREHVCKFYVCEGNCKKGRTGIFRKQCQTCDKYIALPGSKPARTDNRRRKLDKIAKREQADY